ncbi:amidase signature domain-containing protein [Collybia nuda]|uniref:amidase n=1 Tax=Collybia nuda TaxID=64659 RepID=A0A9P6CIJ6_9AGAR|nr:amidase signature domain-containing protein [Collybia nuda]
MSQSWEALVADKKRRQQASIPKEWILTNLPPKETLDVTKFPESSGLLSAKEIEITNAHVDTILQKLAAGSWSAVGVTTAFSKRAVIAHQLTNCLTEIFIDRALARAAELDAHFKKTGTTMGPLHGNVHWLGLPISLKDQITLKGIESTMGYVSWIGKYAERNAVLVDILESLGAVPFVKTNVPQTLMASFGWPETYNLVFGRTLNPHNRSLTCGGSSGGEGALMGMKGAPIGVGSDVGGSIRIPAAFCGSYGLRPSYGRVPYSGSVNSLEGQDSIPSVLGPLSNSIQGLKTFLQGVVSQEPWLKDPLVVRKRWSEDEYRLVEHGGGKQLCFAILWDDGDIVPNPPIIRGLEMTKKALLAAGHKVIDWTPWKHLELCQVANSVFGSGMREDVHATTVGIGEPVIKMSLAAAVPDDNPSFFPKHEEVSAYGLWQLHKKKRELRQEYLNHWQATVNFTGTGRPVDAIISPVAPFSPTPHGTNKSANYTMVWNVLDYTALVIPVSKVDQALDQRKPPHKFKSEADKATYEAYTPDAFKDGPVAIQVVGRTLEEEAVIAMSEIVDAALKTPSAHL